jgi:hypothetical protein
MGNFRNYIRNYKCSMRRGTGMGGSVSIHLLLDLTQLFSSKLQKGSVRDRDITPRKAVTFFERSAGIWEARCGSSKQARVRPHRGPCCVLSRIYF